jgi:predicted adenine nucleotide alpha hydrolase (AANH) superfamily ATPase
MAMAKMKKIILIFLLLLIGIFLFFNPRITPKNYYILSKEQRKDIIDKLSKNCLSTDITGLIVTYIEKYNDKNTARCWKNFFQRCLYNKEHNLTLKIPINCPSY